MALKWIGGISLLWVLGWVCFFLIEIRDPLSAQADSWLILAGASLLPPIALFVGVNAIQFFHRRGMLTRVVVGACVLFAAYAALSAFRYDYVRSYDGKRYTQIDTWFGRQRLCSVISSGTHCFGWQ